jgi:hypothetical protein
MENLFKINRILVLILFNFFVFQLAFSQHGFVVHRVNGEPYLQVNDSVKSVTKGSLLDKNTLLTMGRSDNIHFINDKGDIFKLFDSGTFSYSDLEKIPALENNSSFLRNSLSYAWKEFTNTLAVRNKKSGVVYRGEELIVKLNPVDSAFIAGSEIRFEWLPKKDKEKDYYFIFRDVTTGLTTTIGTPSTAISLTVDDNLFKFGNEYEWTITETRFPPKETPFFKFKILTKDEFKSKQGEIKQISSFLKDNGYSKAEIRKTLCQDFKICY